MANPLEPRHEEPLDLERCALSSVLYARRNDGQILLLKRTEGSAMAGQYFLPGGIVEAGEDPYEAAARELSEESGLVPLGELILIGCYRAKLYGAEFLQLSFAADVEGEPTLSSEHDDLRWVDPLDMATLTRSPDFLDLAAGNADVVTLLRGITTDLERYLRFIHRTS